MRRLFVIQEHDADNAGLHWDIRFEDIDKMAFGGMYAPIGGKRYLKSFVIPKHKLPEDGERLLVIPVNDHRWSYREFEGTIYEGYGKGTVKLIHSGSIKVPVFTEKEIIFVFDGIKYRIYKASWQKDNNYLITKHENKNENTTKNV